jgi:hypothetical protein
MAIALIGSVPYRPGGNDDRSVAGMLSNWDFITNYINGTLIPGMPAAGDAVQEDLLQPGVLSGVGFTWNSTSSVTVASGKLWSKDTGGTLHRYSPSSATLSGIPTATNARLDQIVFDPADSTVKRLAGVNTVGATIGNRNGAVALTGNKLLLFDLLVTSTGVANDATGWRDRRPWAVGAYWRADLASAVTTTSGTDVAISSTFKARIECSGKPIRITLRGSTSIALATSITTLRP